MAFIVEDPFSFPNKGLNINIGHRYEISLRFIAVESASEVIELENTPNPPCKYENGTYRSTNCQNDCLMRHFQDECGCAPTRYFNSKNLYESFLS